MVFTDIVAELIRIDGLEENQDLRRLGHRVLFTAILVVCPSQMEGADQVGHAD